MIRKYDNLPYGKEDIRNILRELDEMTGMDISQTTLLIKYKRGVLGSCSSFVLDKEQYIWQLTKMFYKTGDSIYEEIIEQTTQKDDDCKFQGLPLRFVFNPIVLCLPYEEMKEIVIHEYAHAVQYNICFLESSLIDEAHGEDFKEIVLSLGGTMYHDSVEKDENYNQDVYNNAKELFKSLN